MPTIEQGPSRPVGATPVTPVDLRIARQTASKPERKAVASPAVVRSLALEPGEPPVDAERVAIVRKAVESGTYPLVPARIADAMIAAGIFLRSQKP